MAKVGKFCLAKRVKVEWLFHKPPARMIFSETARLDLAVRTKAFANFAR